MYQYTMIQRSFKEITNVELYLGRNNWLPMHIRSAQEIANLMNSSVAAATTKKILLLRAGLLQPLM